MKEKNYKKYYILYFIILAILLIIAITKGFNNTIIFKIQDDGREFGIMDGFYTKNGILFYNFLIIVVLNILAIFITIKNKEMKYRNALLFSTIIISMFIPVLYLYKSGGIAGITKEEYLTIMELIIKYKVLMILLAVFYIIARVIAYFIEKKKQ